ncbi:Cytosolic phospholipase A2 [Bulinus truncatus]|nr:Cytosolic phospholipase A2 [Bulinus truncatus]
MDWIIFELFLYWHFPHSALTFYYLCRSTSICLQSMGSELSRKYRANADFFILLFIDRNNIKTMKVINCNINFYMQQLDISCAITMATDLLFDPYQVFEVNHKHCVIIYVKVVCGRRITKGWVKDLMDTPDPYVTIKLTHSPTALRKTSIKNNDINPEWNETFKFWIDPESEHTLELSLVDANYSIDEKIGTHKIPLNPLPIDSTIKKTIYFNETSEVDIEIWGEAKNETDLRYSLTLSNEEKNFIQARTKRIFEYMKENFDEMQGIDTQLPRSYHEVPIIGVIGSGGGFRAMVGYSGALSALSELGVLNLTTYLGGLSGSSWYLSQLYSHPYWPYISPGEQRTELKHNIDHSFLWLLKSHPVSILTDIWSKKRRGEPVSFTDVFGHLVGHTLLKDRLDSKLSDQQRVLNEGQCPMPLYSCLHVKKTTSPMVFHEWIELSPYEIGLPKYGTFLKSDQFSCKFFMGCIVKKFPEPPLHFLQGIWGSAFCIQFKRLFDEERQIEDTQIKPKEKSKLTDDHTQKEPRENGKQTYNDTQKEPKKKGKQTDDDTQKEPMENGKQTDDDTQKEPTKKGKQTDDDTQKEPKKKGKQTDDDTQKEPTKKGKQTDDDPQKEPMENGKQTDDDTQKEPKKKGKQTDDDTQKERTKKGKQTDDDPQKVPRENGKQTDDDTQKEPTKKGKQTDDDTQKEPTKKGKQTDDDTQKEPRENGKPTYNDTQKEPTKKGKQTDGVHATQEDIDIRLVEEIRRDMEIFQMDESETSDDDEFEKAKASSKENTSDSFQQRRSSCAVLEKQSFWNFIFFKLMNTRLFKSIELRAAHVFNFLRGLSMNNVYPFSPFRKTQKEEEEDRKKLFGEIHTLHPTKHKKLYLVDSGLTFNSPYPLLLRPQRFVDLILSFDFSGRPSDDTPPFKELKLAAKNEIKPGVPRTTQEERDFANFSIFDDPAKPYSTFKFTYSHLEFDRLAQLMEYNTLRNRDVIFENIAICMKRRRRFSLQNRIVDKRDIPRLSLIDKNEAYLKDYLDLKEKTAKEEDKLDSATLVHMDQKEQKEKFRSKTNSVNFPVKFRKEEEEKLLEKSKKLVNRKITLVQKNKENGGAEFFPADDKF